MNLQILDRTKPEPAKRLFLWLEQEHDGTVVLCCTRDPSDPMDKWSILGIKPDGTMVRHQALIKELGLQLDDNERILEDD